MGTEIPFKALSAELGCLETVVEETEFPGWDSRLVALLPLITYQDTTQAVVGKMRRSATFPSASWERP